MVRETDVGYDKEQQDISMPSPILLSLLRFLCRTCRAILLRSLRFWASSASSCPRPSTFLFPRSRHHRQTALHLWDCRLSNVPQVGRQQTQTETARTFPSTIGQQQAPIYRSTTTSILTTSSTPQPTSQPPTTKY